MNGLNDTSKENNAWGTIVLSLGTNLGDKLENLKMAEKLLKQRVGGVVEKSSIYESTSWGFESDNFYNISLVLKTNLSMNSCLEVIQSIELEIGRVKDPNSTNYENRLIDIDIVFNDQTVIFTDKLKIPHYLFSERKFVLEPCAEIYPNFIPPGFTQNLKELLEVCEDSSVCKKLTYI